MIVRFFFTQVFLIIDIYIFIVSAISNCLKQLVLVAASYDNSSCLPKSARNTRHKTYLMFWPHSTHGVCVMQFQVNDRKKKTPINLNEFYKLLHLLQS